jgi:ADP-ribose pyrophosphatase
MSQNSSASGGVRGRLVSNGTVPACSIKSKVDYSPAGFRWLQLKRIEWVDPNGRSRFWESVERATTVVDEHNEDGADAVAVVAKATDGDNNRSILIIKQFRPPVGKYCLELPAGLIDAGESPSQAALREMYEETGYTGTISSVSPLLFNDPGITNANMMLAVCCVDLSAKENIQVEPSLHEGEFIESLWAPYGAGLLEWLLRKKGEEDLEIDARLMMYAAGMHQAYVDIDDEIVRGEPPEDERGTAPSLEQGAQQIPVDDDDVEERNQQPSSRNNINLMRMKTERPIGPREICAWGVAAVSIIAGFMQNRHIS